jgi:hypothetical protein
MLSVTDNGLVGTFPYMAPEVLMIAADGTGAFKLKLKIPSTVTRHQLHNRCADNGLVGTFPYMAPEVLMIAADGTGAFNFRLRRYPRPPPLRNRHTGGRESSLSHGLPRTQSGYFCVPRAGYGRQFGHPGALRVV